MERIDFIRLSLLASGYLYFAPNYALSLPSKGPTIKLDGDYSIASSSLTLSRLLLNQTGKAPKELSLNLNKYASRKDIDSAFYTKVNALDTKLKSNYNSYLLKPNPKITDKEFEDSLNKITSISRAGAVALFTGGAFLVNPYLGKFLAESIAGGMVYDAVKDWVMVDGQNTIGNNPNDENIQQLRDSIQNLQSGINTIQTTVNNNSQQTESNLSVLQNQIVDQNNQVSALLVNQKKSIEELINQRFINNSNQLNTLGNQISATNDKINIANAQLNTLNSKIDFTNINIIQSRNQIIEVIGGKVDTIGKYVWLNLPPELQMQALIDKDLAFVQDLENNGELETTKLKLQEAIDSRKFEVWYKDLQSKLDSTNKMIRETYKASLALGLKGKDAERAGRVVDWAQQASSIVLSFASSNPMGYFTGVMQSISLIGSIFGGRPDNDPVLEALKQISEQINNVHQDMIKGFEHLDKKLDALADLKITLYKNLASAIVEQTKFQEKWFIHISEKLNDLKEGQGLILKKIDDITEFIVNERDKKIKILEDFEILRIEDIRNNKRDAIYFDTFEDYAKAYNSVLRFNEGLIALDSIVSSASNTNNLTYFSVVTQKYKRNLSHEAYFEATELYAPCKQVFEAFYKKGRKNTNIALKSLLFPTNKLIDNNKTFKLSRDLDLLNDYYNIEGLDDAFLSPTIIAKMSRLYIVYSHYYEIFKDIGTLEPSSSEEYLQLSPSTKRIRVKQITKKIDSLITITNQALAQQSVMSGHLLLTKLDNILFHGLKPNLNSVAKKALRGNYILAHNFVKYIIFPKLNPSANKANLKSYNNAYSTKSLYTLSKLTGFNVTIGKNDNLEIELLPKLKLYLPNGEDIVKNEMLYPSDIDLLMLTKQKLIQKKTDIEFGLAFS